MKRLEHFLWICSLSTGGVVISFATFVQSLWQGLTIWPFYEQTDNSISKIKFVPLKELLNEYTIILIIFCAIWGFVVMASIVSSALLIYASVNHKSNKMCPWFYAFSINSTIYFVFGIIDNDWLHICLIGPQIYCFVVIYSLYVKELEDNILRNRYNSRMAKESQEAKEHLEQ